MPDRDPHRQQNAKCLRRNMTEGEVLLWVGLKLLRRLGAKFRRQVVIGTYITDFACHKSRIVVELDGWQHAEPKHAAKDAQRDAWLESRGYKVMRFGNALLWPKSDAVLGAIADEVEARLANRSRDSI